jgi:hypothetical protein
LSDTTALLPLFSYEFSTPQHPPRDWVRMVSAGARLERVNENDLISKVKKGNQLVNKTDVSKSAPRKVSKLKVVRRLDPATERMAFRLSPAEKIHLQQLASEVNRTDSNYIRDVMLKHLASVASPK